MDSTSLHKWFNTPLKYAHCSQLPIHAGKTCLQEFLHDQPRYLISGMKYFSPLILAPLVLKGKTLSIEEFKDTFRFYFETALTASATGSLATGLTCLSRNTFGEYGLWSTFVIPTYISGQLCWFFPRRSQRLYIMTTTQVVLEAILRRYKNPISYFLLNSKTLQTVIFMMSSAMIMHYKRAGFYNGFWFIQPEKNNTNGNKQSKLEETESFWKNLLKECKKYFAYGLGLDILNIIVKEYSSGSTKQGLAHALRAAFRGSTFKMTSFFLAYFGIYKMVLHCAPTLLSRSLSPDLQHAAAAFAGGASYMFLNKLTVNTFAVILAIQIAWQRYCQEKSDGNQKRSRIIANFIKNIPFSNILLPFNMAYIALTYFLNAAALNSLGKNLTNAVTNQKLQRVMHYLDKHDLEYIIRVTSQNPRLRAF